jgi:hypothetical protein
MILPYDIYTCIIPFLNLKEAIYITIMNKNIYTLTYRIQQHLKLKYLKRSLNVPYVKQHATKCPVKTCPYNGVFIIDFHSSQKISSHPYCIAHQRLYLGHTKVHYL